MGPAMIIVSEQSHCEQLQREQQRAEIAWCHNGGNPLQIGAAKDTLNELSVTEQCVVARTGCYDFEKVQEILSLCNGNIEMAVENIIVSLDLMANASKEKIAKQLTKQKIDEMKEKKQKKKKQKKKKKTTEKKKKKKKKKKK